MEHVGVEARLLRQPTQHLHMKKVVRVRVRVRIRIRVTRRVRVRNRRRVRLMTRRKVRSRARVGVKLGVKGQRWRSFELCWLGFGNVRIHKGHRYGNNHHQHCQHCR
mgnify:CR=1 FL=1